MKRPQICHFLLTLDVYESKISIILYVFYSIDFEILITFFVYNDVPKFIYNEQFIDR